MSLFVFNAEAVLRVSMICAAILFLFVVVGLLVFFLIELVERDCRREIRFDMEGRHDDSQGR